MGQILISVPSHLRDFIASPAGRRRWEPRLAGWSNDPVFIGTDPRERRLGSGGGTVNLLVQAWGGGRPPGAGARRKGKSRSVESSSGSPAGRVSPFSDWLAAEQRLVLHAGGESRRLPSYAALGKAFLPMPAVAGLEPRRFDQMLADFQVPGYRQVLQEAGKKAALMVTSGDVWLDFDPLQVPVIKSDIVGIGMRVSPEVASHFGVFFVAKGNRSTAGEKPIEFFLQKPAPEAIYRYSAHYDFYVDTGMWLLSVPAVEFLLRRCRWDGAQGRFSTPDGNADYLDLYTEIGSALGAKAPSVPALKKLGFRTLSSSVIGLDHAHFYHLGSNRQLFESFEQMQRGSLSLQRSLASATPPGAYAAERSVPVWLDGVAAEPPIELSGYNVAVGIPPGAKIGRLLSGQCLEIAPTGASQWVVRPFSVDDTLRGVPGKGGRICGQDARAWLEARGLVVTLADVFDLELYPMLPLSEVTQAVVDWFFALVPDSAVTALLAGKQRVSAAGIAGTINYERMFAQRDELRAALLQSEFSAALERGDNRVFAQDFLAIADFARSHAPGLARWLRQNAAVLLARIAEPEQASRLQLLLAVLSRGKERERHSAAGYQLLQASVVASNQWERSTPSLGLKDDQIVWARSPVRLDLAGGWTDTPPYCFEYGGSVLNVAVLLNGQPPIQVFVRPIADRLFRLRSIDLGSAEEITTFEAMSNFRDARSGFSLPKAALMLAGFHPDFAAGKTFRSLRRQLEAFGGGLEISLLSAVPKGSGLGTSSILGATLLGALNRACSLGWDEVDLYQRVLGVEQLLTTGGGWQDQAGALFRGVKLIQTLPGLAQTPTVRYVSEHLLGVNYANRTLLLYYTGVTRLAKGILKEIVHDMFLGRSSTLRTLALIRANADHLHRAMQESDQAALVRCIARSWDLNRRLDPGTSTPQIEEIIAKAGDDLAACKLLGAGGGGYMLMCAKSAEGSRRIRERLEGRPPNKRARFIDFAVSDRAVEVTVS
jgi:galactokinase/mevalonate kinase-like predicted kinase